MAHLFSAPLPAISHGDFRLVDRTNATRDLPGTCGRAVDAPLRSLWRQDPSPDTDLPL